MADARGMQTIARRNVLSFSALAIASLLSACTGDGGLGLSSEELLAGPTVTVTTDATSYTRSGLVTVNYDGLPGDPTDWIGIARDGADDEAYVTWHYTDGSATGSVTFAGDFTDFGGFGSYVARAYPTGGIVRSGESTAFTMLGVTSDRASYLPNQSIVVSYVGFTADPTDWITIVAAGSAPEAFGEWHYTTGNADGQMTFQGLPSGSYEVRAFFANNATLVTSIPITVSMSATSLTSNKSLYGAGESVQINYAQLGGNATDWVGIYVPGTNDVAYIDWSYTTGTSSGTTSFANLPQGTYVARVFDKGTLLRLAETLPFTISSGASLTTQIGLTGTITVNYDGMTLDATDWITIVPASAPAATFNEWHYTTGAATGSMDFQPLPPGNYEARAYLANGVELAASASFSIAAPAVTVSTDKATYTTVENVTVQFSNAPGNLYDWVGVAPVGSPVGGYVYWDYLQGETSGTRTFPSLPAGDYEARVYYNNGVTLIGSSTFTVAP